MTPSIVGVERLIGKQVLVTSDVRKPLCCILGAYLANTGVMFLVVIDEGEEAGTMLQAMASQCKLLPASPMTLVGPPEVSNLPSPKREKGWKTEDLKPKEFCHCGHEKVVHTEAAVKYSWKCKVPRCDCKGFNVV